MNGISKTLRIIQEFRKLDPELQSQSMQAFVHIAMDEGLSIRELADKLGASGATASRNVALLGEKHRSGGPGLLLVIAKADPTDSRIKRVYLTSKGKLVAQALNDIAGE